MKDLNKNLQTVVDDLKQKKTATPVTIRTFLSWFDMQRRTSANVEYINQQLKIAEIKTVPDYLDIWVDTPIAFELIDKTSSKNVKQLESPKEAETFANSTQAMTSDTKTAEDPSFRIGKIESANNVPISVKPTATLNEAITLMLTKNFSQLPVMTTDREVKGVISWESIGKRNVIAASGNNVQHYMDEAHEILASASIFSGIKIITEYGYVLIRSNEKKIIGIVTSTDITHQFEETSTPFLLLAEIENNLRAFIDAKLSKDDIKKACGDEYIPKNFSKVSQLTFGNYVRILENEENWAKLSINLDRSTICSALSEVNDIRNDVMHFDPDPLKPSAISTLRNVAKMLDSLRTFKAF